jgi:hypothetical protein
MGHLNCENALSLAPAAATLSALHASASEVENFVTNCFMTALREAIHEVESADLTDADREALQRTPRQVQQRHVDAVLKGVLQRNDLSLEDLSMESQVAAPAASVHSTAPSFVWSGGFSAGV